MRKAEEMNEERSVKDVQNARKDAVTCFPEKAVWTVWGRLIGLYVAIGVIMRIALACHPLTEASTLSFWQWMQVFGLGAINDALMMSVMTVPLLFFLFSSGHWKLRKPQCYALLAILAVAWVWVMYGWKSLRQFNGALCDVMGYLVIFWFVSLALRTFVPKLRKWWMRAWTAVILFVYLVVLTLNACGVWLFWDEFGVRYNFIAVDYLIYTTEVVGNIMQSYSMGWIITGVLAAALALEWLLFRSVVWHSPQLSKSGWRWRGALVFVPALAGAALLPLTSKLQQSDNVWCNQLQANEAYSFVDAFMKNRLDYREFYFTVDDADILQARQQLQGEICHADTLEERLPRVIVLVTMESMSGDYLRRFGNEENLTPTIDSLWNCSLAFDNMFATGNRTVRGLEALTLSRPPAPGESIIKRPEQKTYPSIADPLRQRGYEYAFYYGGDSYFDNMKAFFGNLGYDIRDRNTMAPADVTCQTIWGVCDGDVYDRLLSDIDAAYAGGKRMFANLLTTSNHRPYIYPEGCVDIPPKQKSRAGAVKYSDYALGAFLREAAKKPWHRDAVFVIVADHCASSSGSTELPLVNYHIPALIHAPGFVEPQIVEETASQIDLMPTLFGMLGWQPDLRLYGRDVLSPCYNRRAYLATYQDMGYYQDGLLTVLSPGRKVRQFDVVATADDPYLMHEKERTDSAALRQAASLYQLSSAE